MKHPFSDVTPLRLSQSKKGSNCNKGNDNQRGKSTRTRFVCLGRSRNCLKGKAVCLSSWVFCRVFSEGWAAHLHQWALDLVFKHFLRTGLKIKTILSTIGGKTLEHDHQGVCPQSPIIGVPPLLVSNVMKTVIKVQIHTKHYFRTILLFSFFHFQVQRSVEWGRLLCLSFSDF